MTLQILTNSRLKHARACLRYDKLRYRLGYKTAHQATELRFGSLFHAALEAWFLAWQKPDEDRLVAAMGILLAAEADPYERVTAEELMFGYHHRWIDAPLEVIAVEAEFVGPLVNPQTEAASKTWERRGKIDALVRDLNTGLKLIVEHKTSKEDIRHGSEYWRRLRMDSQISTYHEGARFLGHEIGGCLYDVIKKPSIRPSETIPVLDAHGVKIVVDANGDRVRTKNGKKWRQTADTELGYVLKVRKETPEEFRLRLAEDIAADPSAYYQRGDVVRLEAEMHEALLDDWNFGRFLRDSVRDDAAPRNPDACKQYGRLCEFFDVCTGAADINDPIRFVRLANPFTELSLVAVPATEQQHQPTEQA